MYVCTPTRVYQIPCHYSLGGWELPYRCWKLNSGPPEEQPAFSLQRIVLKSNSLWFSNKCLACRLCISVYLCFAKLVWQKRIVSGKSLGSPAFLSVRAFWRALPNAQNTLNQAKAPLHQAQNKPRSTHVTSGSVHCSSVSVSIDSRSPIVCSVDFLPLP